MSSAVFVAQVVILEYRTIICETFSSIIHIHTASCEAVITRILYLLDKKTRKKIKSNPRYIKKGDIAIVAIELQHMMCLSTYNDIPHLGRFTLRDEGEQQHFEKFLMSISALHHVLTLMLRFHNIARNHNCRWKNTAIPKAVCATPSVM